MNVSDVTDGKYYHTDLIVTLDDGREVHIELSSSDPKPSAVEIAEWGSYEEWREWCSDGHYEREATRIVADQIIQALSQKASVS